MTKEDKQIIDRAVKEEWRIFDRTRLKHLLKKNLELYRENAELEQQVKDLELTNSKLKEQLSLRYNLEDKIALLEQQIEKMKKYGKLLQDICAVLGNDSFMVAIQLELVVEKLWDTSEEKEGLKMVEDIKNRLLKIKPQDWAEIDKWEIKENE